MYHSILPLASIVTIEYNTKQSRPTNEDPCHLLALPAELRNYIYILSLTIPEPLNITIHNPDIVTLPIDQISQLGTTLLATCKQINSEATCFLYSVNTLSLRRALYIPPALSALSPGAHHIHTIEISHATGGEVEELVDFLPQLSSLQTVIVHEECCKYTNQPIQVVTRLGPLLKALHGRQKQRGGKQAMDILSLPTTGRDGKWWMQVEEGFLGMVEFLDAAVRSRRRVGNF